MINSMFDIGSPVVILAHGRYYGAIGEVVSILQNGDVFSYKLRITGYIKENRYKLPAVGCEMVVGGRILAAYNW